MQTTPSLLKKLTVSASLALFVAAAALAPSTVLAGGNGSTYYDTLRLNKISTEKDLGAVKAGDLVVRSCSSCNAITAVKMPKSTKGNYELLSPKCEYCGANTVSVRAIAIVSNSATSGFSNFTGAFIIASQA